MDVERSRTPGVAAIGLILIALGLLFLLSNLGLDVGGYGWPLFVIGPGLLFFVGMVVGGRKSAPLAIPGSIVTTVGLILLYQSTFDHFGSWAYAWALITASVGVGTMIDGWWRDNPDGIARGWRMAQIGLLMFAIGLFFFELVINMSGMARGAVRDFAVPGLLIVAGLYLFLRRRTAGVAGPEPAPIDTLEPAGTSEAPVP